MLFWGDSTFRQLYLDALHLATAHNGSFDDPSCMRSHVRNVELPRGTEITKLSPIVPGERADGPLADRGAVVES